MYVCEVDGAGEVGGGKWVIVTISYRMRESYFILRMPLLITSMLRLALLRV
jgi:hypothetical protein